MELEEFFQLTEDLLFTEEVLSMDNWKHHGQVTCLEHSLFVAYTSYRIGKKLKLDVAAIARGGLLHDLYLYHKRDKTAHSGWQCLDHPKIAVENGKKITTLSSKEENIILAHMWPCGGKLPRSMEAVLVNGVDTFCAILEFLKAYHPKELFQRLYRIRTVAEDGYQP